MAEDGPIDQETKSTDAVGAPPAALAPVKRRLFQNAAVRSAESREGVGFFSRSSELFNSIVKEERQKRQELQARKASGEGVEKADHARHDGKRRRISTDIDSHATEKDHVKLLAQNSHLHNSIPQDTRERSTLKDFTKDTTILASDTRSDTSKLNSCLSGNQQTEANVVLLSDSDDEVDTQHRFDKNVAPQEDEAEASEEEFPELVAQARANAKQNSMQQRIQECLKQLRSQAPGDDSATSVEPLRPPETLKPADDPVVELLVTSQIEGTKPLVVRRKLTQRLKDVRMAWCDRQVVDGSPMTDAAKSDIILTWRGNRVFDVTSCKSMGLKLDSAGKVVASMDGVDHDGKIHLEAWTEETLAAWKEEKLKRRRYELDDEDETEEQVPDQPVEVSKLKVILKAKEVDAFFLKVKATTTFQQMIDVFRSQRQIPADKNIALYLDGDKMDPAGKAGDEDLEDECTIDVHIQ